MTPCCSTATQRDFHTVSGSLGAAPARRARWGDLDWVVTCASAVEARAALEAASRVLKELGVTINPQKTRIVHVRHGFEFLGYKIKRGSRPMNLPTSKIKTSARRGSLYAYPREKSINHFKEQIRRLTRRCAPVTTRDLIQQVNPVVRGWGHHYKRAQVRKLFHRLDGCEEPLASVARPFIHIIVVFTPAKGSGMARSAGSSRKREESLVHPYHGDSPDDHMPHEMGRGGSHYHGHRSKGSQSSGHEAGDHHMKHADGRVTRVNGIARPEAGLWR